MREPELEILSPQCEILNRDDATIERARKIVFTILSSPRHSEQWMECINVGTRNKYVI